MCYETVVTKLSCTWMFSNKFQVQFLAKWKSILEFWKRFVFITPPAKKKSLIFPTGVIIWEIKVFHWSPIFRNKFFLFYTCFSKAVSGQHEMYFKKPREFFYSRHNGIQKPPSVSQTTSWIRRYRLCLKTYFSEKKK